MIQTGSPQSPHFSLSMHVIKGKILSLTTIFIQTHTRTPVNYDYQHQGEARNQHETEMHLNALEADCWPTQTTDSINRYRLSKTISIFFK